MKFTLCAAFPIAGVPLLSSCAASPPPAPESLEILAEPQFEFRAGVASPGEAWNIVLDGENDPHLDLVHGERAREGSASHPLTPAAGSLAEPEGPYVEVRCTSLALNLEQAAAYLGWYPDQAWAMVVERDPLEDRVQEVAQALPEAALVDSTLHIVAGSKAHVSRVNQTAFVRDYNLTRMAHGVFADPCVGVLGEGLSFALLAEPLGKGLVSLWIDLAASDLQQAHQSSEFRLPSGTAVRLQQPLILAQSLQTTCEMNSSQALLLVMLGSENSGELLFTVLTVQPYTGS